MENRNTPGYMSEKSALALLGGAVPIVWGCAELGQLYKPGSIINISHCATGDVEAAGRAAWDGVQRFLRRGGPPAACMGEDVLEWFSQPPLKTVMSSLRAWLSKARVAS